MKKSDTIKELAEEVRKLRKEVERLRTAPQHQPIIVPFPQPQIIPMPVYPAPYRNPWDGPITITC